MNTISRQIAASLLLAASLFSTCHAQAQGGAQVIQSEPLLKRNIAVAELGFAEGAQLGSLGGTQTFFFPVPRAARVTSGTLSFAYDEAAPFEGRRSVLVTAGERTVLSRALPVGHGREVIDVPLLPGDFAGDFVKVTVRYSGVVTDDRCVDLRLANDRFTILPETTLVLDVAADRLNDVATVVALMPSKIAVGVPDRKLTEQEMAAAISAVKLFKSRGRIVEVVPLAQLAAQPGPRNAAWQRGDVIIAAPSDLSATPLASSAPAGAAANARVIALADGPGLLLTGSEPQLAVDFLASDWRSAATGSVLRVSATQPRERSRDRLTFDQLGIATPASNTPDQAIWTAPFSATDIPAGRRPAALDLHIGIGTDGSDVPAVANVFLNGRFLAGTKASKDGITHLHALIPRGLVSLDNVVRVVVQRQPRAGDCTYLPPSFPAQLLGSSAIELGDAEASIHDFFELAPHARNRLTVLVRQTLNGASQRTALQILGTVAADLVPGDTPIAVRRINGDSIEAPDTAFIAWGDFRFKDGSAPVRIDRGNVLVRTRSGTPLFNLSEAGNTVIAQLVAPPNAPAGIWLSDAGAGGQVPAPQTIALDRGDVAFVGASGVALALSTEREKLVEVSYSDSASWGALVRQYRIWAVVAVWLALTIVVLLALQRIYRRRGRERQSKSDSTGA